MWVSWCFMDTKKSCKKLIYRILCYLPVGMTGFEPALSRPPDAHFNRAKLHPEFKQKTLNFHSGSSGERGIRTPGGVTLNSFQDCRIRPLCHFSNAYLSDFAVANIQSFFVIPQTKKEIFLKNSN